MRHASYLQYDSQGRVIIPENLCRYAEIEKEIAVIGVIKKIELWSPSILNDFDSDSEDLNEFEDLADEISF